MLKKDSPTEFSKYGTYIRPDSITAIRVQAAREGKKDYLFVQEAIDRYLSSHVTSSNNESLIDDTKPLHGMFFAAMSDYWRFRYLDEADGVAFTDEHLHVPTLEEFETLVDSIRKFYDWIDQEHGSVEQFNQWMLSEHRKGQKEKSSTPKPIRNIDTSGYVYLLHSNGTYKIGRAKNLSNRMLQISPALPHPVELVHSIQADDYIALESELHERFSAKRLNGEWFNLSPEDVEYIRSL